MLSAKETVVWLVSLVAAMLVFLFSVIAIGLYFDNPEGEWCPDQFARCFVGEVRCADGAGRITFQGKATYRIRKKGWTIYPADGPRVDTSERCTSVTGYTDR